jgi:hypothetical protein
MMIANVIAKADSEHVIYFLLGAYLEAIQFGRNLPERLTSLPVRGLQDVEARYEQLIEESRSASRQQREKARLEIDEALHIFDTALRRLQLLERESESMAGIQHFGRRSSRQHAAGR